MKDLGFNLELLHQQNVLVLGAAKSGVAAACFLKKRAAQVMVSDYALIADELKSELNQAAISWEENGHQQATLEAADLIVVSPGIPMSAPPLRWARERQIPVISEIELASHFTSCPVIAITGSNGKTTTVSLLRELLKQAGYKVGCGGNIGTPMISLVEGDYDYLVIELSSFQLETTFTFKPEIAVLLNIYPNHLNRHHSMENYFEIKSCLFQAQTSAQMAILNADNDWSISLKEKLGAQVFQFSCQLQEEQSAFIHQQELCRYIGEQVEMIMPLSQLPLKGKHNLENYLAVLAISGLINIDKEFIQTTFSAFNGVPHRLEFVKKIASRSFINDSKATNYLATIKAIESFDSPIVLIAGGEDKGGDFAPLAQLIRERVRNVVLIGEAAQGFTQKLNQAGYNRSVNCLSLEIAIDKAFELSHEGDIILLSPACASYDMFKNFENRGEVFKAHVTTFEFQT